MMEKINKVYFIGIEGAGTSALAVMMKNAGIDVSGSDEGDHFYFDILDNAGIRVFHEFNAANVPPDADLVVYSLAFKNDTNPETALAREKGIKMMDYGAALALVFNSQYGISVCGCHGKTTTSAWLAFVLSRSGLDPKLIVGGKVAQFGANYLAGKSDYFVLESDEYGNKLQHLNPRAILLNNIDYDHPDFFPTMDDYLKVFVDFIQRLPKKGWLVGNFDDPIVRKIAPVNTRAKVISYAIYEKAEYMAYDIQQVGEMQYFKVKIDAGDPNGGNFSGRNAVATAVRPLKFPPLKQESELGGFSIQLSGKHNILNALAVIASAIELGVELGDIRAALGEFSGTARRMETMGRFGGALIITDYAHHPTEIRTTLAGARQKYGKSKIRVVFHPHTFTRTKALLDDFAQSFGDADEVVVLDIYGSAREAQGGVHSRDLVGKIREQELGSRNQGAGIKEQKIEYIGKLEDCEKYLRETVRKDEVIILMGAGDAYKIGENLLAVDKR